MNTLATFGLGGLPLLGGARTRSVCPENPTGEKGKGGMAVPAEDLPFSAAASDLGQGWKVNPFLKVKSGETLTLMDVDGPGVIQQSGWWLTRQKDARTSSASIGTAKKRRRSRCPYRTFSPWGTTSSRRSTRSPSSSTPNRHLTATGPCRSTATAGSRSPMKTRRSFSC